MARIRPVEHVLGGAGPLVPSVAYARMPAPRPPLVLLHGLGARRESMLPLMLRLSGRFDQLAPDLRGHGRSGRTPGQYSVADIAGDIARLVGAAVHEPVAVYGHSLGGWVGIALAAARPDLVRALVVADSAIGPEDIDPDAATAYLAELPITLRSMATSLQQVDREVLEHFHSGRLAAGFDPDELLPRIACPTLLLQGDRGRGALMTDQDVEQAATLLEDAAHVRLDGVGHGLQVEDPAAVTDVVTAFLEGVGAPEGPRGEQ